jgi:hypothetical protein
VYVVITCPICRLGRTAREDQKTAGCPRCGKRIDVRKARVHLRTDDMSAAATALAVVNESMASGTLQASGRWGDLDIDRTPSEHSHTAKRPRSDVMTRARKLYEENGGFTPGELAGATGIPLERIESLLARWSSDGLVFSPEMGVYEFVGP